MSFAQVNAVLTPETFNGTTDVLVADDGNKSLKMLQVDEEKSSGKKVFVWQESDDPTNSSTNNNIYCMVYDKNMLAQFPSKFLVNKSTNGDQNSPVVMVNQTDGSFYVAWQSNHSGTYDIFIKRLTLLSANSDVLGLVDQLVNTEFTPYRQIRPLLTYDYAFSELIVGWLDQDGQDSSGYGGYIRRLKYSGSTLSFASGQQVVNSITTNNQSFTGMSVNPVTGELYTLCQSLGYGTYYNIIFRKFKRGSNGTLSGQPESRINSFVGGDQANPAITVNSVTGSYIIYWTDNSGHDGLGLGCYAGIYDKNNQTIKTNFVVNIPFSGNQFMPKPIWDESSNSIVFFYNLYNSTTVNTVRYQVYDEAFAVSGGETDAIGGMVTNSGYGYVCSVTYNQQNKKIFLVYDVRSSMQGSFSVGKFRQFAFVPPVPASPPAVTSMNYAETQMIWKPLTDPSLTGTLNTNETQITREYMDGLGRTVQKVIVKGSPGKKDVVLPYEYDNNGRQTKKYLTYAATSSDGSYKSNALNVTYASSDQYAFYNNNALNNSDKVVNDNYPYNQIFYESTVPNRISEQSAAGASWTMGSGHTDVNSHNLNSSMDLVGSWVFDPVANTASYGNTTYGDQQLIKHIHVDEMGKTEENYYDFSGRKILDRIIPKGCTTGVCKLETYYVYDKLNQLRFILTPEAINSVRNNYAPWYATFSYDQVGKDNMVFAYVYDKRGRLIEKRTPGRDVQKIMYNRKDQPVLTQDGNMKISNQWSFTKYDALGRVLYTGTKTDSRALSQIQADIDALPLYEKRSTATNIGYTNTAYPLIADADVLSINYYDDYNFSPANTLNYVAAGFSPEPIPAVKTFGLITGTKIKNLGDTQWLITVNYYDKYSNLIQRLMNNQKNYSMVSSVTYQYDFAGRLLASKNVTNVTSLTTTIANRFDYDHAGRLRTTYQQSGSDAEVILSRINYNEAGQPVEKNLHSEGQSGSCLQSIDYTYNVRGMVTAINNSTLTSSAGTGADNNDDANDLFGMQLAYDNVLSDVGNTPMYNGNLSATKCMIANAAYTTGNERASAYRYDNLYRITDATFSTTRSGSTFTFNNTARETGITYDMNGNIKTLQRYSYAATPVLIDKLTYTNTAGQITAMVDSATTAGFHKRAVSSIQYAYDANGNITRDDNKSITNVTYNYLNQPLKVTFGPAGGNNNIQYVYDAGGSLLNKKITKAGTVVANADYVGGMYFENGSLLFIATPEGRIYPKSSNSYGYQYYLKDHLGSVRVTFDKDQTTGQARLLQEDNFYAFGAKMQGLAFQSSALTGEGGVNKELYCGKEYDGGMDTDGNTGNGNEYDWDVYNYGARMYDPSLCRFLRVDPLAHVIPGWSPYAFVYNNPLNFTDPTGMIGESTHTDENGKVISVIDDGDLGVYKHKGVGDVAKQNFDKNYSSKNTSAGGEKMGETAHWDEFINPDTKQHEGNLNYSTDPNQSWNSIVGWMNKDANNKDLSVVGKQSKLFQKYDLKNNTDWANYGVMTGRLLNGKFATARSAGNYLAGLNGITGTFQGRHISGETYLKLAGALQTGNYNSFNAFRILTFGTSFGDPPYYGEEPYSGRMIIQGINDGMKLRR